jgi:uncharacterized protein YfaS (alpha-2-macroglobulin family)
VSRYYYFKNKDGVLFDPDNTTAEVYNPSKVKVATPDLVKVADGKYEFNYTLPEDAPKGWWFISVIAVEAGLQKTMKFAFAVLSL